MTSERPSILLSAAFLHRSAYRKAVWREIINYGFKPLDYLNDDPFSKQSVLTRAPDLMRKADGYLTVIDTQYIMKPDKGPAKEIDSEFEEAVRAGLPIGLLVVGRPLSAPQYVDDQLNQTAEGFKAFHGRHGSVFTSLMIAKAGPNTYLSGIRDLLGFLRSRLVQGDGSDSEADLSELAPTVPDQSPAPIRVEEHNGKVSRISDRDSPLGATERDFNDWREPVCDHIQEMLSGDFRPGTNHGRARDRLASLATLLSGGIAEVKERQFRIGYEIERFGGLVSAYRSPGDDMPTLSADVLEDMDRLRIALAMGVIKLERWAEFHRAAAADPTHDGGANPAVVGDGLNEMATEMERQPTYFDPELPETFRFLAEAVRDPRGATRTIVYGGVRSAENLISFLGQKALGIGANALGAVEQHISKAVATALVTAMSGAALAISGAVPAGWGWLQPLLTWMKGGGG